MIFDAEPRKVNVDLGDKAGSPTCAICQVCLEGFLNRCDGGQRQGGGLTNEVIHT